jgi:hypothetical protein
MKSEGKTKIGRRDFLRGVGAGAGVAATSVTIVTEAHADSENNQDKRKARYQANSEHIKAYYRSNNYPS